ncbi:MAG: hypothetical protein RID25_03190, partial [Cyclobacteriaceae bacterium]
MNKCTAPDSYRDAPHASHMANLLQHSSPQAAHQFSPAAVIAYSVFQKFVLKIKARFSFETNFWKTEYAITAAGENWWAACGELCCRRLAMWEA